MYFGTKLYDPLHKNHSITLWPRRMILIWYHNHIKIMGRSAANAAFVMVERTILRYSYTVPILAGTLTILTGALRGFPHYLALWKFRLSSSNHSETAFLHILLLSGARVWETDSAVKSRIPTLSDLTVAAFDGNLYQQGINAKADFL
jgi:hypothetical protein